MSNILDTYLNVQVFVFIGLMVWLYFKPFGGEDDGSSDH